MKSLCCLAAAVMLLCGCESPAPPASTGHNPQDKYTRMGFEPRYAELMRAADREKAEADKLRAEMPQSRMRYVDGSPALKPEIRAAILKGEVLIGMTAADVAASRGEPERRTRTQSASATSDVWTYGSTQMVFQNGVLTSWTETQSR